MSFQNSNISLSINGTFTYTYADHPCPDNLAVFLCINECLCYDSSEEPHAEPGIFQSRCRYNGRKPGNHVSKAEHAAGE